MMQSRFTTLDNHNTMVNISVVLVLVLAVGYTVAIDCFGTTCKVDQEYCQIILKDQTGQCYTHHPGDHCFCKDQACVTQIMMEWASSSTVDAGGSNMTTLPPMTTQMPMTT
ncbi:uncharacterized protein [Mytilus edulis]|uniref:uncharacterized protein isoform X2 n=1 Tax=Mytilus edulis TaxID=6550 RepID=UPI0039EF1AE5